MADPRCPLCARPMDVHVHGEVELDRCPGCGCVYFDAGEVAALLGIEFSVEKGIALAPTAKGSVGVPCPRDGKPMREVKVVAPDGSEYAGASSVVHVCGACHGIAMSRKAIQQAQKRGIQGGDTPSENPDPSWMQKAFDSALVVLEILIVLP